MSVSAVIYGRESGRAIEIRHLGAVGPAHAITLVEGEFFNEQHWIDPESGQKRNRIPLKARLSKDTIVADGKDEAVLGPLPVGCVVMVGGRKVTVNDGSLEISTDSPDDIEIAIDHWPFLPASWMLTAEVPE